MGEMNESTDLPNPRKLCGLMERVQLQWENKEGVCLCVQPTVEEDLDAPPLTNTKNNVKIQSRRSHLGFENTLQIQYMFQSQRESPRLTTHNL